MVPVMEEVEKPSTSPASPSTRDGSVELLFMSVN